MKYHKITLPNGLRVITVPTKGNPSVTTMVIVETGSNYETKAQNGLSHFLEHMCFKGTTKRPTSMDISRELESIGADNNAFTSHEVTGYHAKAEKRHFKQLLDVVSDIYLNSTLPLADLEKERGVIIQELNMYEDLPKQKVWNVLNELLYGDTPAGRTILGTKENLKSFTRADFVNYREKHYVAGKTTVIVVGDITPKSVETEVKKHFKNIATGKLADKEKVVEKQKLPQLSVLKKKSDQAHLLIALRSFGAGDRRSAALAVLVTILGRGSSSRLFQKMREEMGACYYVHAGASHSTDHGMMIIAAGIEAKRTVEVTQALLEECRKLRNEAVLPAELSKAKEYFVGHMYLNLETTDALAGFYVDEVVETKKPKTPQEVEKAIRKVTAKEVMAVAKDLFKNENLNLAIVGDIKEEKKIKKVLTLK